MDTTLFLLILVAALLALAANTSTRAPQPPIVYVQTEAPRNNDVGCLALIVIGLLLMKVLGWL